MDVTVRPALDGARQQQGDMGFASFVRTGATLEMKAFTGVSGDAVGYAVPREIDAEIWRVLTCGVSQAGDERRHAERLGGGDGGAADDRDAGVPRDRAAEW